ncbi:hypothetical protein CP973_16120 [Streptomyces albofaciens JCM 4342]|uniref:hypothetical protein n=1 Tax=Streptomyces albofaciens TaxID=66866 RepID=UPI00123A9DC2|nr:hypothetical protein [Streptomyces albofaciens]KAA6223234.1 hypothetical protein CP973_16120 [Streptomyces albofaciens JCM 4342]
MRRALIPLGAAALLCAGCSGGAADKAGQSPKASASAPAPDVDHGAAVKAAVAATVKGSARIDETIEMGDGATTMYSLTIKGDFDWAGAKGRLKTGLRMGRASDAAGGGPEMEQIFSGGTVYVGGFPDQHGAWGSVRRDKAEAQRILRAPLNDPEHVLKQVSLMRGAKKAGEEQIGGRPAVHYRGRLDNETIMLRMSERGRTKIARARQKIGELVVYADAWVGRDGRIVRTRLSWPLGAGGCTATMNLTDFGKAVRVTVPAPGKVTPMPSADGPMLG